jgi:hypothetical protein
MTLETHKRNVKRCEWQLRFCIRFSVRFPIRFACNRMGMQFSVRHEAQLRMRVPKFGASQKINFLKQFVDRGQLVSDGKLDRESDGLFPLTPASKNLLHAAGSCRH